MATRLGVIGGGNMGRAIVRGAIGGGVLEPEDVLVVDVDPARRQELADLGCHTAEWAGAAVEWACGGVDSVGDANPAGGQLMLAVKPQVFPEVAQAIAPLAQPLVVMSIMAGRCSRGIRAALGDAARIVRIMPSTPCMIGAGMSAIAPGAGARLGDEAFARQLFGAVGRTIDVDESLMHAVTAVSGSGPAYVFLLAEAMERAAEELDIVPEQARVLVAQTLLGASRLLEESGSSPVELRAAVTSRGGTTAAAIDVMLEAGLPEIIIEALTAARDRGRELES